MDRKVSVPDCKHYQRSYDSQLLSTPGAERQTKIKQWIFLAPLCYYNHSLNRLQFILRKYSLILKNLRIKTSDSQLKTSTPN